MSKQREAMKQALHALQTKGEHHRFVYDAMKALAEALAEPEQEPVAWMLMNDTHCHIMATDWKPEDSDGWKTAPLYTAPPARKSLTDEEIKNALMVDPAPIYRLMTTGCITGAELNEIMKRVARAIERAHGIGEE